MHEHGVSERPVQDRRAGERRQPARRRASRPQPVRPGVGAVAVRPAEADRPVAGAGSAVRPGWRGVQRPVANVRTLPRARFAPPPAPAALGLARRVLAGLAVAVASAAVVVALGWVADATAAVRAGEGAAERIVTDSSLTPVPARPGQVLTVTPG